MSWIIVLISKGGHGRSVVRPGPDGSESQWTLIRRDGARTPINLAMRAGSVCDSPDAPGAMYLLSRVVDRGTLETPSSPPRTSERSRTSLPDMSVATPRRTTVSLPNCPSAPLSGGISATVTGPPSLDPLPVDEEGLAERLLKLRTQQTRKDVGRATGRVRRDELHRLVRIRLGDGLR